MLAPFWPAAQSQALEERWRTRFPAPLSDVAVGAAADLFVVDALGVLHRLDSASGAELAELALEARIRWLFAAEASLLALADDDRLFEVEVLPDGSLARRESCLPAGVHAALPSRDLLVLAFSDATLGALRPSAGALAWRAALPGSPPHRLASADTLIVAQSEDGSIASYAAHDGKPLAETRIPGPLPFAPALLGAIVVAGPPGERLHGIDALSGKSLWRAELGRGPAAPPLGGARRAYVATQASQLVAVGPKGSPRWRVPLPARVTLPPVLWGSTVLVVPDRQASLLGFGARTGHALLAFHLASGFDWFVSVPAVDAEQVYLATRLGYVVGLGAPRPERTSDETDERQRETVDEAEPATSDAESTRPSREAPDD